MWRRKVLIAFIVVQFTYSAMGKPHHHDSFLNFDFDLRRWRDGWQAGFADYRADQESFYELAWAYQDECTNLNRGFFISGDNHSDDLFMFIKRPVCNLEPSTLYEVEAWVEFWSKAPTGCAGVGGDPGASVFVKFGAAEEEPSPVIENDGMVRMNVDIGHQAIGGANAVVIGNIATSIADCHNEQYELKELETLAPIITRSDPKGTLWIFVGTDSGFEGETSLIYTQVRVQVHRHECGKTKD